MINCSDGIKRSLDQEGYLTSLVRCNSLSDINWSVLIKNDLPFDFVLIDEMSSVEDMQLFLLLENIKLISKGKVKVLFCLDNKSGQLSNFQFLKKIREHGFQQDFTFLNHGHNSYPEHSNIYISAMFFAKKTNCFNLNISTKELQFCEITKNFVRQNERAASIGLDKSIADLVLNQQTALATCDMFSDASSFIENKSINIITSSVCLNDSTPTSQYDCIVAYITKTIDESALYSQIRDHLTPGGRLIVMFSTEIASHLDENIFDIEAAYGCFNEFTAWESIATEGLTSNNFLGLEYDDLILCVMKSPFIDTDKFKYIETSYNYSQPPKNLLAFERDYINPWIVKSMVEFPFRNKKPSTLKKYAEYILSNYGNLSADYGAALAILGYQCIEHPSGDYERSIINRISNYCDELSTAANLNAHQIRWLISLNILAAELNKKNGEFDLALQMYLQATNIEFERFSSTIGTKILQAYYNIAIMLFSKNEHVKSEEYLRKGILKGYDLLSVSPDELYGNIEKPLQFTLFIYHDILDWLIKLTNAKNFLLKKSNLLPSVNDMTWSSVIRERFDIIKEMDSMIKQRDEAIQSQATIMEDRFEAIHNMDLMLKEKSEVIKAQSKIIDERWEAMVSMEKMIEERDEHIRNLEKEINNID